MMTPSCASNIATSLVVTALATACGGNDPSRPTDHMQIYQACLQTLCEQEADKQNAECQACISACLSASYDCDPSAACTCATTDCSSDTQSSCVQQGFKVTLPNNPSAALAKACNQALSTVTSCGDKWNVDCSRYAVVDLPADATFFACVAALDCGSLDDTSVGNCFNAPLSTVGDDFCAQLASRCAAGCTSGDQTALDGDGALVREDAIDALQTCVSQPSCEESRECLQAWRTAVE